MILILSVAVSGKINIACPSEEHGKFSYILVSFLKDVNIFCSLVSGNYFKKHKNIAAV